jgi:acyl transferase domain-containing protein
MVNKLNAFEYMDAVAIIGIAGRFPKAKTIEEFWQNLQVGVESISFFSDQELESSGIETAVLSDPNYVKAGVVLEDIELFDAAFFGYPPRQAEIMDPQHRLFLESAWEALECAGYNSETYEGRISVYGGVSISSYFLSNLFSNTDLIKLVGATQIENSNSPDNLATQVAYKLNLKGSAMTVQTSCSTSLVAVHLACQSLLDHECHMALAGGVSIGLFQKNGYFYQEGGIASPDGHCRAFDAKAQGTVSGSGVGIVVLKRLEDAITDGDHIHAVIKGSAINNDGSLKVGYTAPSVDGQAKVIAEALAMARTEAEMVSYVEAHGTGTVLGDPIEIKALTEAFRATTDKKGFCAIGSVKTNIGHLGSAAGVTGLIKTVLALKHKLIPPSLHFEQPNPQIDFANSPFYVNTALSEWKSNGTPRRAGVSSFGIGGTNAHVILEEAPTVEASSPSRPWQLLVLSTKTSSALETATTNLVEHLKQHPDLNLADVAYTLQVGRQAFSHRRTVVCQDIKDATVALQDPKRVLTSIQERNDRPVAFMFPGLGTHYINMAWELYQVEPTFREQVDRCCKLLKPLIGLDLRDVLYPSKSQLDEGSQKQNPVKGAPNSDLDLRKMLTRAKGQADEATQKLNQTFLAQPTLFVIEYALAQLWNSWGIHPQVMLGYSIGEYVAACLAGVFSLKDALTLVAKRAQMIQELPGGAMLAVPLSEQDVHPLLGEKLFLSAIKGPSLCVISGSTDAVDELSHQLTERGLACCRLQTSHAFHSKMMAPIAEPLSELVKTLSLQPPKIPYLSNITGTWITAAEATDPTYWTRHLCQPVRFAEGIAKLLQEPERILLEVGPGGTLSTLSRQHQVEGQMVLSSICEPHDQQSDVAFLMKTLGQLWLAGVEVDWSGFYAQEQRHRIPLPTYPFERKRYWIESSKANEYNPSQKNGTQKNLNSKQEYLNSINIEATEIHQQSFVEPLGEITDPLNTKEEKNAPDTAVEKVIAQQLEIMSQQLDVLRKYV